MRARLQPGRAFYLPDSAHRLDSNNGRPAIEICLSLSLTRATPHRLFIINMPFRSSLSLVRTVLLHGWHRRVEREAPAARRRLLARSVALWQPGARRHQNSNTGLWPWSYDVCDEDLILPPFDPPQRISACDDQDRIRASTDTRAAARPPSLMC